MGLEDAGSVWEARAGPRALTQGPLQPLVALRQETIIVTADIY